MTSIDGRRVAILGFAVVALEQFDEVPNRIRRTHEFKSSETSLRLSTKKRA